MNIGDKLKLSAKSKIYSTDNERFICEIHFIVNDIIDLIGVKYAVYKDVIKRVEIIVTVYYKDGETVYDYEFRKMSKKISKYYDFEVFKKEVMDTIVELLKTLFAVKPVADAPKPISTPPKRPSTSPTDSHKTIITPEQRKRLELLSKNKYPKQQPSMSPTERKKHLKNIYDKTFKKK